MSEAFDEESTRQESCNVNDFLPGEQALIAEARSAAAKASPTVSAGDLSQATDIKNTVLLDIRGKLSLPNKITSLYFYGSVKPRDYIINRARQFWNSAKVIDDSFIQKCLTAEKVNVYSVNAVNEHCNPFPAKSQTINFSKDFGAFGQFNADTTALGSVNFAVQFFITGDAKLEIFYSYSYTLTGEESSVKYANGLEVKGNKSNLNFFEGSFVDEDAIRSAMITAMQKKIENVAKDPVEDCYTEECKLDNKVCMSSWQIPASWPLQHAHSH